MHMPLAIHHAWITTLSSYRKGREYLSLEAISLPQLNNLVFSNVNRSISQLLTAIVADRTLSEILSCQSIIGPSYTPEVSILWAVPATIHMFILPPNHNT